MGYFICNGIGESKDCPSEQELRKFLRDLDPADVEHGAAWVSDDAGNTLEFNVDGRLVFSRDGTKSRHLLGVSAQHVLELWLLLIHERLDDLEGQPWVLGSRPSIGPEEAARRERERFEWQHQQDRAFYDSLGPERDAEPCRKDGCRRGHISHSGLCRPHHFENVQGRPCPFDE
jgi:hypothetical protein